MGRTLFQTLSLVFTFFASSYHVEAQFNQITHVSGTQNVAGVNVTVIPTGAGASTQSLPFCNTFPYWVGANGFTGSYTYNFSVPVPAVRFECAAMDSGDVVSFMVNGLPYMLTNANLNNFLNTCNTPNGIIQGGSLVVTTWPAGGGGGQIDIESCNGITSVTIIEQNNDVNGTTFNAFYSSDSGAIVTAGSNSPICEGGTINLIASNIPGANYTWTGPNGFMSSVQNPSILNATSSMSGNYIGSVNGGCSMDTVTVLVEPLPSQPNASSNSPVCENSITNLVVANVFGGTFNWSGPGFSSSSQNPSIFNTQLVAEGLYTVTVTVNSCTSIPDSIYVDVVPAPVPPVTQGVTYCQFDQVIPLDAIGQNLLWYGSPIGGLGSPVAPTPDASTAGVATYYVSQTVNGCESSRQPLTITIKPKPQPPVYTGPFHYCKNDPAVPLSASGQNVRWYLNTAGGTALITAPTPSTAIPGDYMWYASQTIDDCESDRTVVHIHVGDIPPPPEVADITYCQYDTSIGLTAIGQNIKWYSAANGSSPLIEAPVPSTALPATTTWYVTQTIDGCESQRTQLTVKVLLLPTSEFARSRPLVCQHDTLSFYYTGNATSTEIYNWTIPDGAVLLSGNVQGPIITRFDSIGTYHISLSVDNLGCKTTNSINVKVIVVPDISISIPSQACRFDTVKVGLDYSNSPLMGYTWNFDGGLNLHNKVDEGPYNIQWHDTGVHTVSVSVFNGACTSDTKDSVRIHELPNAQFLIQNVADICVGDTVQVSAVERNSTHNYQWYPSRFFLNTGNNTSEAEAHVLAPEEIILQVTSTLGCTAQERIPVTAGPCCTVILPTAFSPNGDSKNDVFRPITEGYHSVSTFLIVNRWGQTVFETRNELEGWDGKFNSVPQDIGTYYYYFKYKCNGKILEKKGDFHLIR